jgi:SecD/SecF fusion protein
MTISNPNARKRRPNGGRGPVGPRKNNPWTAILLLAALIGSILAVWRPWDAAHKGNPTSLYSADGYKFIKLGLDLQGGLRIALEPKDPAFNPSKDQLDTLKTIVENRVNSLGVAEPLVQTQGTRRVLVELPGLTQEDQDNAIGLVGETGKLTFQLVKREALTRVQTTNANLQPGQQPDDITLADLEPALPGVDGSAISNAQPATNQQGAWEVAFQIKPGSSQAFGDFTGKNIGRNMAIVLDGEIKSYPTIQAALPSGGQITGSFDVKEATNLAFVLKSGSLPFEIKPAEIRAIGPTLGADAIQSGAIAAVSGVGLVFVLGFVYYGFWFGLVIALGLLFSGLAIVGILGGLGSVLTLPGIAGLVLTIGAAVDGNVISFERIKEELRRGKGIKGSIGAGFGHSLATIVDVNLSHLLSAFALYNYSSGPVKGFAVTLMVGVVASVFSNLVFSKWMLEQMAKVRDFSAPQWFTTPKVDFIKAAPIVTTLSVALAILGAGILGTKGLQYGVDFTSGTAITLKANETVTVEGVREVLEGAKIKGAEAAGAVIQRSPNPASVGGASFIVKVQELDQARTDTLKKAFDKLPGASVQQTETVGPAVGDELRTQTIYAMGLGLLLILVYVAFRFDIIFGVGSILAVIHDVAIVLGMYALLGNEFTIATVAAVLTLIGYSLNDSIIVSDRMRENLKLMKGETFKNIVNASINQTLSRTLMTSLATLLPLVTLFFFGGPVLRDFSLILIVGIVIGTYSSIYIVAPAVVFYENWITNRRNRPKTPAAVK